MRASPANVAASGGSHRHNPQPVGTSGTATNPDGSGDITAETQMFTVAGVASAELTSLAGKRVEITGRIDTAAVKDTQPTRTDAAPATPAKTQDDVDPDAAPLIVETIRAVDGACPASQK
jgi:hypothetical protein